MADRSQSSLQKCMFKADVFLITGRDTKTFLPYLGPRSFEALLRTGCLPAVNCTVTPVTLCLGSRLRRLCVPFSVKVVLAVFMLNFSNLTLPSTFL